MSSWDKLFHQFIARWDSLVTVIMNVLLFQKRGEQTFIMVEASLSIIIIIQKHLPWSTSDCGRRSHAHSDRRASPEPAPAVTSCCTVPSHLNSNAPINNLSKHRLSARSIHKFYAVGIKLPYANSFVYLCAELCGRSEQKTLYARIIEKTGSWRALSFTEPEHHLMLRNWTGQNGEDQLSRVIRHGQLGDVDPKTSRALQSFPVC